MRGDEDENGVSHFTLQSLTAFEQRFDFPNVSIFLTDPTPINAKSILRLICGAIPRRRFSA
jgi:hypothetical protein